MGFSAGGFISRLIKFVVETVGLIKSKPKVSDVLLELIAKLPSAIFDAIQYGKISTIEQLEDALVAFDEYTGIDVGALDIIKDLPQDKEEELFDALKTIVEILGKNKLKVDGYYIAA